uniref:Uncharacterized protein LOC114339694 n=1 Tax=Diabrotica virgifera virgifera TaxID=50390 RepID=A0A6P7GA91_DIAVI
MASNDINKELEKAVNGGNLEQVKALLCAGANANRRVELGWSRNNDTLLHITESVEIAKELLLGGAYVNATNRYNETPLFSAITGGKGEQLVRELLKYGVDVNATNRRGNTALHYAVIRGDLEVVKELLEYGADINIRNRERRYSNDRYSTSLDYAVDHGCARLLIKFTLLMNFNRDYRIVIDLSPYKGHSNYSKLSSYLDACVREILQMKTDKIKDGLPLYKFITNNFDTHVVYSDLLPARLAKMDYSIRYPIYHDIITDKVKQHFLERADLLKKLHEIQFYTKLDVADQDAEEKKIILDHDSTYNIAQYLSNDNLLNFIAAFNNSNKRVLQVETNTRLNETSISNDTKRARLE